MQKLIQIFRISEQIQKNYITLFEIILQMLKKTGTTKREVDLAIDYTEILFYGDRKALMVVGKKPEKGTTKCYKFATINIVEAGQRFTLLALPVGPFDLKKDILIKLLTYAMKRVKIRIIYIDRGFFDATTIRILNSLHLKYLIRCTQIPTIKKILDVAPSQMVIKDFKMKDVKFNVVVIEDETGEKRAYATNLPLDENDPTLGKRLLYLSKKRWGIETSYRVKKRTYLPKTTSKNYQIRLFYFLFSVLLYNLWIIADILLWLESFNKVMDTHLVTSKLFGAILCTINLGRG